MAIDIDGLAAWAEEITPKPVWSGDVMIIDGKNLIYRLAYRETTGERAAAVFLEKLAFLREWYKPSRLIVGWEGDGRNWRFDHLPDYKGHRDRTTELQSHVDEAVKILPGLLANTIFDQATTTDAEGDDVFGTLAASFEAQGLNVSIYSMDQDLWQLATDRITIIVPINGPGNPDLAVTAPEAERRVGVPPNLIPDLKGFQGDTGDNIPGVPGIGKKIALALITKHGTFAAALALACDSTLDRSSAAKGEPGYESKAAYSRRIKTTLGVTPKKREDIRANAQLARNSFEAGKILRDIDVRILPRVPTYEKGLRDRLIRMDAPRYIIENVGSVVWLG